MDKPLNSEPSDAVKPATGITSNSSAAETVKSVPPPPPEDAEEGPPLTPVAWLKQNGFYLAILAAIIALIVHKLGWIGLWQCFLVVIGLGFVIFIHELGHFLTAKWCDVHVRTFSLGFGPALPGCSFRYGETLYKIALFPLGGYVGMVGEGTDIEEGDDYPRSFKNKTVGQRMLIISAGVIMNVLFGCIAFVLVYRFHGIERGTMNIGGIEAGGPAWQAEVRSNSTVAQIGSIEDPFFDQLKMVVSLSGQDEALPFRTRARTPEGGNFEGSLTPRCDANDMSPVIGVAQAHRLTLIPERAKSWRTMPVFYDSAAAAARVLEAAPGTKVFSATDEDHPEEMKPIQNGWAEVAARMRKLRGKPLVLFVDEKSEFVRAKPAVIKVEDVGFQWDDDIVGTTDPEQNATEYDPFVVKELPLDQTNPEKQLHDYFEFRRRMKLLASQPIVIQVHRKDDIGGAKPVNIFVPPQWHRSLGVRMRMGEVAAIRNSSPAAGAGLQPGDVITGVKMMPVAALVVGSVATFVADLTDPCRLPFELERLAERTPGTKFVWITVDRPNPPVVPANGAGDDRHKASKEVGVGPMVWDDSWRFNDEFPSASVAALSIAELGIAYRVDSTVVSVKSDSPADKAGLLPDDEIIAIAFRKSTEDANEVKWQDWFKLEATRGEQKRFDRWAYIDYSFQVADYPDVQLKIRRLNNKGEKEEKTIPADLKSGYLTAEEQRDWSEPERGLILAGDTRLQKADTMWAALKYGVSRTVEFILNIYQSLRSLATRRVSPDLVQGPVGIAQTAFVTAEDPFEFLLFLGLISVNLAVVNFLPIPVLDGGHMVFLIYEKLRGKPASETVQKWAMVGGLALLGLLMAFVVYKEALLPFVKWMWRW